MNSHQILVQAKKILESGMTDSGKVREVLRLIRENEKTGTKVCATCGLEKSVAAFNGSGTFLGKRCRDLSHD